MLNIKVELDIDSIDKAIKEIKDYRESLNDKLYNFLSVLLQDGTVEAQTRLASTVGDATHATVSASQPVIIDDKVVATIYLEGTEALFIEFGAGIAYNTGMQHPKADELGYGIGTYPSKNPPNKAINPGRWIYGHNDDGSPLWSIGTQASMPIYYASETMRNNAIKRAMETLRS